MKLIEQRCVLELYSFISYVSHLFAETDNGFQILED